MYKYSRIEHVGLDAHIEHIAVGIVRSENGEAEYYGEIRHKLDEIHISGND